MKVIYLSSEMTGVNEGIWRTRFLLAEDYVSRWLGCEVINPADFEPDVEDPQWEDYIKEDIQIIVDRADVIYAFGKWWTSTGSLIEILTGIRMDKEIWLSDDTPFIIKTVFKWFEKKLRKKLDGTRKEES